MNINTLIGDLFAGASSAYATFVGYDEVAHHSGVESKDALDTLKELDRQFRRIERATKDAPRPYHLVVLSDHGQSGGATFKQRYHVTLEDLVQKMISNFKVVGDVDVHEDWKYLNVFLTEAVKYDNSTMQKTLTALLRKRIDDGSVVLGPEEKSIRQTEADKTLEKDKKEEKELPTMVVLASGNLGLIYSSRSETRLTEDVLNQLVPGLLVNLSQHEGKLLQETLHIFQNKMNWCYFLEGFLDLDFPIRDSFVF